MKPSSWFASQSRVLRFSMGLKKTVHLCLAILFCKGIAAECEAQEVSSETTIQSKHQWTQLRNWTDARGRTIEAGFIEADEVNLSLDWNGKRVTLPLTTFNESSRKLAKELSDSREIVIRPANEEIRLDGLDGDWKNLEQVPKLVSANQGILQLSHDQKHLLALVMIPNPSHQPLPSERMEIELSWTGANKNEVDYPTWELGVNKHGVIEGQNSSGCRAAFRHDLASQATFFELAIPLSSLPKNFDDLFLRVDYYDDGGNVSQTVPPTHLWRKLPLIINEFTADQESAGKVLDETDFDNLTSERARHLISNVIPIVGNTASGFRAFSRSLSRADFSPLDRTKAIVQFMHRHPENPNMRNLVLTLFRSRLGKMGWEKSFNVVKAVSRSAKIPRSAVYDGLRGHYWDSPKIAVKDWHAIGPFPFDEIETQGMKLPDKLSKITLRENYSFNGQTLRWKKVQPTEKHFSDLRRALDSERHGKAFAVTWVNSVEAQNAALEIESSSPSRIWINGWLITTPIGRGNETVIQLNQGWNQILLENESVTTGKGASDKTWQFRMSLMHPLGMGEVPGLSNFTSNSNPNAQ
ncbi:MAG: hypothetical protein VYA10_12545 [Verrucomicrobiota bacterium]|nr:hypothetical protein [Verrucomicrobiota bacterium]